MKMLVLAAAFLLATPAVHAKSIKETRKVSSSDFTALPREVQSAQAQPSFKAAYAKLVDAFHEDANHDKKNLVLLGYNVGKGKIGPVVQLHYGTSTDMWPTGIFEIGVISVSLHFFPDGIVGFSEDASASFEKTKKE